MKENPERGERVIISQGDRAKEAIWQELGYDHTPGQVGYALGETVEVLRKPSDRKVGSEDNNPLMGIVG